MAELTTLSRWLHVLPARVVAVQQGLPVTAVDFETRVTHWLAALQRQSGGRWAVYHPDALEFLAIVFALWQLQRIACIPGDNCPGTVQRLTNYVDGFVGVFPSIDGVIDCSGSDSPDFDSPDIGCADTVVWRVLAPEFCALEIYTSGSTGEPKAIVKTIAQLECEIEVLESWWPGPRDSVVLATVSHQHIYGMMFRLFWPLSVGRPFERQVCEYSEDILHQARHYSAYCLISSPSHLGRINTALDWVTLPARCESIISSAAPLTREDSLKAGALLRAQVHEIYGSSETGAVAWRAQVCDGEDALWQPLPQNRISTTPDGTLCLHSPYLGSTEPLALPDRIEVTPQSGFKLLGRVDRIVKVEGKRVSLSALEQQLETSDMVAQAKALILERQRVETAVVIQLTAAAQDTLQQQGRKALIGCLKAQLSEHFETVVLPRRWRFVEQMPYNVQGKLPLERLHAMFDKDGLKWPTVLDQQVTDNEASLQCHIPAELVYFDGHFAGNPILPGIVQVHWAEAFGRRLLQVEGRFQQLEVVKFQQVILPHSQLSMTLKYDARGHKLTFKYESPQGVHSSGRICFG